MKNTTDKKKVYVAMSGGVDSSVSAALLQKAGYDVVGVYMRQWSPKVLGTSCMWKQDRQDAMLVCAKLGIPFLTWDFAKEYEKQVGKYMIDSYKKGITPNPDVMCNKVIKFGLFFDRAIKEGADFVATGHYARSSLSNKFFSDKLLKAKDKNKDQTYFLYTLKQKQLSRIIFPVGDLTKPEVRVLAKKFGLENAEKKDSQGVCFVGPLNMKNFLKSYIKPKKGKIILLHNNKVIGSHDGAYYYTIGQRHGLDIKDGSGPYFVVKKDIKKNVIYVGTEKDLFSKKVKFVKPSWIAKSPQFPAKVKAQIRYRGVLADAVIYKNGIAEFKKPQKAVASGQSIVFYVKNQVIGGAIIK